MYSFPNFEPVCCSMSGSNYCFLTCIQVSQEGGKLVWYSYLWKNFPVYCHPHKGFSIVNEAEIDVFLKFLCSFDDPVNAAILISGFSSISKSTLYIWKFLVHVVLNPSLKDFEHDLDSFWNECNRAVVWTSLALPFFEIGMKTDLFWSCGHCWVFRICWHIESSTLTASSELNWKDKDDD